MIGSGSSAYLASYNANGEMVCRSTSTTASQSCYGGNDGGAQMSYDAEGQLVHWQNAPGTSPTSTVNTLYDGGGRRLEQVATIRNALCMSAHS